MSFTFASPISIVFTSPNVPNREKGYEAREEVSVGRGQRQLYKASFERRFAYIWL